MEKFSLPYNIIASSVTINEMSVKVVNRNSSTIGPMLDDVAPQLEIGVEELRSLYHLIMTEWNGSLESIS